MDPLDTVAIRGYQSSPVGKLYSPSPYTIEETLTFDTETEMHPAQRLRVGCYIYRVRDKEHVGMFYDNTVLDAQEIATLTTFGREHGYNVQTIVGFQMHLLRLAQRAHLALVGFNLPYDLSRVASQWRVNTDPNKNGFTFSFGGKIDLDVRHLNARKSMYTFHGAHKANCVIIDCMTLGAALSGRAHSLSSLAQSLGVAHMKTEAKHGETLTIEYLDYLVNDVRTTQDCFDSLMKRYSSYGLDTPAHMIFSEASLGKAFLRQFGIVPSRWASPIPDKIQGLIMSTYYGGRSEVHIRRKSVPVTYTDFLSMYPTVCSKMHLWQFVIAKGIVQRNATEKVRELLREACERGPDLLRDDTVWGFLPTIVRIRTADDIFPVRARYSGNSYTIGLNRITNSDPLWYTLADCISSVFLTGKVPEVLEAIRFAPGKPQTGLRSIALMGNEDMTIDPYGDDFYRRLIELRKAPGTSKDDQQSLKILANSTCYGIFVETIRESVKEPVDVEWWAQDGKKHESESQYTEKPGAWYNPILATSITGAARLLLATAERLGRDAGLDWCFCDTDSVAFVGNRQVVQTVLDWYDGLSPYNLPDHMLEVEYDNVNAYCVSAKRYVLTDAREGMGNRVVKASAHGLGYLKAPYGKRLTKTGAPEWINDLWGVILDCEDVCSSPDLSKLHLDSPAMSQLSLNTANLYRQLWRYNMKVPKEQVIRPFGFLALFQHKLRGKVTALAPLHLDPENTLQCAFDRDTDRLILSDDLRTYEDVLVGFHMHPEAKFKDGSNGHVHILQRRHVMISHVAVIGKEANRMDEVLCSWEPTHYEGTEHEKNGILGSAPIHIHLRERKSSTYPHAV